MAKKVTIKYGDQDLELQKSEKLVAIRPRPGRSSEAISGVRAAPTTSGKTTALAGFELVESDSEATSTSDLIEQLRADAAVATVSEVFHTSDDGVPFIPTGEVFVVFRSDASAEAIQDLLDSTELEILERRDENEFILRATPTSKPLMDSIVQLQASDAVEIAEPELATIGEIKSFALPSDSLLRNQWHLENRGEHYGTSHGFKEGADARVIAAWRSANNCGSRSIVVAVIDDGFDLSHPDLGSPDKFVAPRDFSRNNFDPVPDWRSRDWHGTACAGVAVGEANSTGIVGAAPGARLMPVRWGPNLSDRQLEAWFGWVTDQGADIVSCSWGAAAKRFPLSTRAKRAISKCAKNGRNGKGTVICFAAGNSNRNINNPPDSIDGFAIHPDVIAVAACNSRDIRSNYSNFGKEIWLCAPSNGAGGWGILTSDVTGTYKSNGITYDKGYSAGAYTSDFGGTSSACPLVAGVCALMLSVNPALSGTEVREILKATARKIQGGYDSNGHSEFYGYGCVDAHAAVNEAIKRKVSGK